MKNVLLLTSSPRGDVSFSTQVATELARKIVGAHITVRDLGREPVPHLSPAFIHAAFTPEADRTPEQRDALALSDRLIAELKAADILVIGVGMINFGIPSSLKAWIDQVTRAGLTFSYGETGPQGLVTGKQVILVLATGGVYSAGAMAAMDYTEPYLRAVLGFLGMTEVETIRIEGVALGPEMTEKALTDARTSAATVAAAYAS